MEIRRIILVILLTTAAFTMGLKAQSFNKKYEGVSLKIVLRELESFFNVSFSYVEKAVNTTRLSETLQGDSLEDAIAILESSLGLRFSKIDDQTYVIARANSNTVVQGSFKLTGIIKDEETGEVIPGVNIIVSPIAKYGTITKSDGSYELELPEGHHEVRFSFVGFQTHSKRLTMIKDQVYDFNLKLDFIEMESVEITPGAFEIDEVNGQSLSVSKEEILHSPAPFRDVYRALKIIPGYANDDISAKPRIRGGHWDETAIFLDGLEIYESSHIEEVEGLASIFDTDIIDNVKVLTGGFGPKYTDKLSGIIEIQTPTYLPKNETNFSIDFLAAKASWRKSFGKNTNAIINMRRGYLDLILDTEAVGLNPKYYDIFGKINHSIGNKHQLSIDLLYSNDDMAFNETQGLIRSEFFNSLRKNFYLWGNWKWMVSDNFSSHSTIGFQDLNKESGFSFEASLTPDNVDNRHSDIFSFTNRNYWDGFANHAIEFGMEFKGFNSAYRFSEARINSFLTTTDFIWTEIIDVDSKFSGTTTSFYLQDIWSLGRDLKFQYGARLSHQSFTGQTNLAPRLALSYQFSNALSASIAYGIYYQADNFQKLRSYIGQERPFEEVAKSTHYTANLTFNNGPTLLKANFFYKDSERLFDDYRYDFFNRSSLQSLVETPFGTTSGEAYGFEIFTRHTFKKNLISVSYALSEGKIRNAQGEETFRDYDYRHIINLNSIFRLKNNYSLSALWTFHTGGPYTPSQVQFVGEPRFNSDAAIYFEFGKKNSARLPDYHSMDLKIEKTIYGRKATFNFYLSVINMYSRINIKNYIWDSTGTNPDGSVIIEQGYSSGPELFVSPGIKITF